MLILDLFTIAKNGRNLNVLHLVNEQILWYSYPMKYCLAIKGNKLLIKVTCPNVKFIFLYERSQLKRLHNV